MPSDYQLKRAVLDSNRVQKYAKRIMDDSSEDRKLALEAYHYFKSMVDENPNDSVAKQQMSDCLKLAQTSKANTIKAIDILIKYENAKDSTDSSISLFTKLEQLTNE
tara:strand:- start:1152 stop:1472 length:321 start_codon:yes stop_codon:yes gene_type:complete